MERFVPDSLLFETIIYKSNRDKALTYQYIFTAIDDINSTSYITYKIDPSYLEQELMNLVINYYNDDDFMLTMDNTVKEVVLQAMKLNGITLSEDIPMYILAEVLEGYNILYNIDPSLTDSLLDMIDAVEEESPTFTFIKLLNEYVSCGFGYLSTHILNVDMDVLLGLKSLYEYNEDNVSEGVSKNYVKDLTLFAMKYNVHQLTSRQLLSMLKYEKTFNQPFKDVFPLINKIILSQTEMGEEEYVDLITLGYLSSREGYNYNKESDDMGTLLNSFGLLTFRDMDPKFLLQKIKDRIENLKK